MNIFFNDIYIDEELKQKPFLFESILSKITCTSKPQWVRCLKDIPKDKLLTSKTIFLTLQKGRFLKKCPCSKNVISCGYYVINMGISCIYDCSYCFLKTYTPIRALTLYVNLDEAIQEVRDFIKINSNKFLRIGTGEFTDSLILDPFTNFSEALIKVFLNNPRAYFELKTKSINVNHIIDKFIADPISRNNIVFSWSLNPDTIASNEEADSPNPHERLLAAQKISRAGFSVGFHFDPIIYYPRWEKDYENLIKKLFLIFDSKSTIKWISLGALRFPPEHREYLLSSHERRSIYWEEMVICTDRKLRYLKTTRVLLFKTILGFIKKYRPYSFPIYLCMEPKWMWEEVFK